MNTIKSIKNRYSVANITTGYSSICISGTTYVTSATTSSGYVYLPYIMSTSGVTFVDFEDRYCPHCGNDDSISTNFNHNFDTDYCCDKCHKHFSKPMTKKEYIKFNRERKLKRIIFSSTIKQNIIA